MVGEGGAEYERDRMLVYKAKAQFSRKTNTETTGVVGKEKINLDRLVETLILV